MSKAKVKTRPGPRHGNRRAWAPHEVALLGKISDAAVAQLLGLARRTVLIERQRRGIRCANPKHRPTSTR